MPAPDAAARRAMRYGHLKAVVACVLSALGPNDTPDRDTYILARDALRNALDRCNEQDEREAELSDCLTALMS